MFLWSEEQARAHRASGWRPDGAYLTMNQAGYMVKYAQSALFGWEVE
jgi:hypothetical protein